MSKLYDVISRLEDVASQEEDGQATPLPELTGERSRQRPPWLKILIFSLVSIVIGLLIIAATGWLQKWFSGQQSHLSPGKSAMVEAPEATPAIPQNSQPPMSAKMNGNSPTESMDVETGELLQKTGTTEQDNSANIIEQFEDTMSVDVATEDISVETLDQFLESALFDPPQFFESSETTWPIIFIRDLEIAEVVVDPSAENEIEEYVYRDDTTIGDLKAKSSRWLHQAELYRHNKEWEGAIRLYQRVWDIYQDPAVANNLAAALIEIEKPEEAQRILLEAIASTPNDPDIKENLRIVAMILAQ